MGGQTPLNLADAVEKAGVPILGTQPASIDLAEDRDLFSKLINRLDLNHPKNGIAYSLEQARLVAERLRYPLVIPPSYVLGGRAMQIVHNEDDFETYVQQTLTGLVPPEIRHKYPNDKTGQINSVLSDTRCCSTAICRTLSRSTSIASPTAVTSSSAASWSTSRRRVSIRATAPARCPRTISATRPSPS